MFISSVKDIRERNLQGLGLGWKTNNIMDVLVIDSKDRTKIDKPDNSCSQISKTVSRKLPLLLWSRITLKCLSSKEAMIKRQRR